MKLTDIYLKMDELKKTSEEWSRQVDFQVLDPDGWDRELIDYSWNREKITYREFMRRASISTISFRVSEKESRPD